MSGMTAFILAYLALWLLPFGTIIVLTLKANRLDKEVRALQKKALLWKQ